jgi:hypothetical protein
MRRAVTVLIPPSRLGVQWVGHLLRRNFIDINVTIRGTSKQSVAIRGPSERNNPWEWRLVLGRSSDLVNDSLGFEIPDFNALISGSAEPVVLGGESQSVDSRSGSQRVQVLALIDIPEHSSSVLTTRSNQRTVWGNGQGVNDTSVTNQVGSELAVSQVPYLDDLVPTSRNNQGLLSGRRESNTGNPVVMLILLNGVLALTESVPELDGSVTTS